MSKRQRNAGQGMFALRCVECNRLLVETPSGWLSCPLGHGRLVAEPAHEAAEVVGGSLFDAIPKAPSEMTYPKACCSIEGCTRPAVQEIVTDGGMGMHWRCSRHSVSEVRHGVA